MKNFYTRIVFLCFLFSTHYVDIHAQIADGLQIPLGSFGNWVDNVTTKKNGQGAITDYTNQYDNGSGLPYYDKRFEHLYVYSSNSGVTYPFPAGQTVLTKSGGTHKFSFGAADGANAYGYNAYHIPLAAQNNNTVVLPSAMQPGQGLYLIYTFVGASNATVGSIKATLTLSRDGYSDQTVSTTFSIYDYRRGLSTSVATGTYKWPMTSLATATGSLNTAANTTGTTCAFEVDLSVLFGTYQGWTPTKLYLQNNSSNEGSFYIHAITEVPEPSVTGTIYNDNTDDKNINGTGSNVAAPYASIVDVNTGLVTGTANVNADGTYIVYNSVAYASGHSYRLILTSTKQIIGNALSTSSLTSGWVSGTTPNASYSGDGTTSYKDVLIEVNSDIIPNVNFSVHQLPTAYNRTVTLAASNSIRPGASLPMNVTVSGDNVSQSLTDQLLDLSGFGANKDNTGTTADLNGASTNTKFLIPTALTDGSLTYSGTPVSANTIYPSTSATYSKTNLYYQFGSSATSGTKKQFTFTYKILDNINFISSNAATYTINLPYALPVKYSKELEASANNNTVDLSWTTGSEINNKAFHVQRSTDAQSWSDIGVVNSYYSSGTGAGHSYSFTDEHPLYGLNYYRLNQVDKDGASDISRIVQSYSTNTNTAILISPNPVIDFLNVKNLPSTAGSVTVFSMNGSLLKSQSVSGSSVRIDLSSLASGIYLVNILDKNGAKISVSKIVKK